MTEAQNTYLKNDKGNQRDMSGMRVNDRQMKQAMKKMGIKQSSVDGVTEVIIRTRDKEIVVKRAEVICIEMGGTKSFQVSGETEERMIGEDGVITDQTTGKTYQAAPFPDRNADERVLYPRAAGTGPEKYFFYGKVREKGFI